MDRSRLEQSRLEQNRMDQNGMDQMDQMDGMDGMEMEEDEGRTPVPPSTTSGSASGEFLFLRFWDVFLGFFWVLCCVVVL